VKSTPEPKQPRLLPLELREIAVRIGGRTLLDVPSLTVQAGEPTILLGPNGAGKTLLLRICHGLLQPTQGEVAWQGREAREPARHQAMVFQQPVLLRRSARANIDYALRAAGVPKSQRRLRTEEVLCATGLLELAEQASRRLSVGEQQRLALARAWALRPEVLFLDEPTASLDPGGSFRVEQTIAAIAAEGEKIIMSTHDLGLAQRLAGEILFLHRGRILERALPEDFFREARTREARAFLAGELTW